MAADRQLLFGLIALQVGLIDQAQLIDAFRAWVRDKSRGLADHLGDWGSLDVESRAVVEAMVALHLKKHDGEIEKSIVSLPVGRSTRESLARLDDPEIVATLGHLRSGQGSIDGGDLDRTTTYAVGTATSSGQRFRVLRPHAQGGLGAVFVALDDELHREVALKQILDSHADDPGSRDRFLLEAEITGGLEHPGIVPVYGLGTYSDGRPYYAMRFIRGDSLKEAIERFHADRALRRDPGRRSLELRKLSRRFVDVCNAIEYAHSRGVLHRDIKPGNIIVGKHGETLVVDWGLAKALGRTEAMANSGERTLVPSLAIGSAKTLPGSALGTPAYMSPEQAEGDLEHLGPRSDVYSLGATLYYLLTGRPPFEGELGDVVRAVRRGELRPPRQLDPTIDRSLEAICLRAMALKCGDRYSSPRALADDLERWMADLPVMAWREPLTRRARRWARRHRPVVTALAAATLMALVGSVAVLAVQAKANAALTEKNLQLTSALRRESETNEKVQARFALAMEAVEIFHTGVSRDVLLKQKEFTDLRARLLRGARGFYQKLEDLLKGQSDRPSRQALAKAYYQVADLSASIASREAALEIHRKGLSLRRSLLAELPEAPAARAEVGESLLAIGELLSQTGRLKESLAQDEEAVALLEATPKAAVDDTIRVALGTCFLRMGFVLWSLGRPSDALETSARARTLFESLVKTNPANAKFQEGLESSDNNLGIIHASTGHPADALAAFERLRTIREEYLKVGPNDVKLESDLASSHANIGVAQESIGLPVEALAAFERERTLREAIVKANPNVSLFQNQLAKCLYSIGRVRASTGSAAEALSSFERSRTILATLAADNPTVTSIQIDLANSILGVGYVQSSSRPTQALAAFEHARTLYASLVKANPAVPHYQASLVNCNNHIGSLLETTGRPTQAIAAYEQAVVLSDALWRSNPRVDLYQDTLVTSLMLVGNTQASTGRPREALAAYERARDLCEVRLKAEPTVTVRQARLASTLIGIGNAQRAIGRSADALASHQWARTVLAPLVAANPTVTDYRKGLEASLIGIGESLHRLDRRSEALVAFQRAREVVDPLVKAYPTNPEYRGDLASCLIGMGQEQQATGRPTDALASFARARAILAPLAKANSTASNFRKALAFCTRRVGTAADIHRVLELYELLPSRSGDDLYEMACCHAALGGMAAAPGTGISMAKRPVQAETAMALLRESAAAGFRNPEALTTEPALDLLRSRTDFQLLVFDAAFPAIHSGADR